MRALILTVLLLPLAAQQELSERLTDAFATGRWSWASEQAYTAMAFANARKACGDSVPAEFWEWLQQNDSVRPVVAWATAVEPVAKVYACLNQLRLDDDLHALSRVLAAAIPPQPQANFAQTIAAAWLRTCTDLLEHAELGKTARRNLITFQECTTKPEAAAKMRFQLLQQAQGELALVVADGLARTRLLGGGGGSAFEETQSGMRLIGFRCSTTEWSGHRVLASIQPLFLDGAKTIAAED